MAEAVLHISDATETDSQTSHTTPKSSSEKGRKKVTKKPIDALEEKMDRRFIGMEEKMSQLLELLSNTDSVRQRSTDKGATEQPKSPQEDTHASTLGTSQIHDDSVSIIMTDREKKSSFLFDEEGDDFDSVAAVTESVTDENNNRFMKHVKPKDRAVDLSEIFGEDAVPNRIKESEGLKLDEAQISLLQNSWRTEHPERITAYADSYRKLFPIHEVSEDVLKVPTLDETVEMLLIKRYDGRAAFGHNPTLYGRAMKSLEKLAYQGQVASRMGLIINCYIQQALGGLLEKLQSKDHNPDDMIQTVRDIFAMSTNSLDQTARTGAFHHMVRRKATVFDTGLSDHKEYSNTVLSLPLSAEGVFGPKFDDKLKSNQERQKQLKEALPDLTYKQSTQYRSPLNNTQGQKRRTFNSPPRREWPNKRPRYDNGPRRGGYNNRPASTYSNNAARTRTNRTSTVSKNNAVSSFRIPKRTDHSA